MYTHKGRSARGFTLIELLVVIAIIGMLASIILASLNTARIKSRNARRLADLKEIQTALELYFSDHNQYPDLSGTGQVAVTNATLVADLVPAYISVISDDPLGGAYHYVYKSTTGGTFYCLGATYEGSGAPPSSCNTTSLGSSLTGTNLYTVGP